MKTSRVSRAAAPAMLAMVLLGGLVTAQAAALQMRGFRGLMWGDPPDHLGGAVLMVQQGQVRCYQRDNENLLFGDSALKAVRWCFHQDKLFMVAIDAVAGPDALRAEFERGYGPPDERSAVATRWGDARSAVSAELVASAPGAPATLRLQAREFTPAPPASARP